MGKLGILKLFATTVGKCVKHLSFKDKQVTYMFIYIFLYKHACIAFSSHNHKYMLGSLAKHLFWSFSLSQIGDSTQYLEGLNSACKEHDWFIFIHLDLNILTMVHPGTVLSIQVLTRVLYL